MAELVDAYDSGSYVRKDVEVQVFLRAPNVKVFEPKLFKKIEESEGTALKGPEPAFFKASSLL